MTGTFQANFELKYRPSFAVMVLGMGFPGPDAFSDYLTTAVNDLTQRVPFRSARHRIGIWGQHLDGGSSVLPFDTHDSGKPRLSDPAALAALVKTLTLPTPDAVDRIWFNPALRGRRGVVVLRPSDEPYVHLYDERTSVDASALADPDVRGMLPFVVMGAWPRGAKAQALADPHAAAAQQLAKAIGFLSGLGDEYEAAPPTDTGGMHIYPNLQALALPASETTKDHISTWKWRRFNAHASSEDFAEEQHPAVDADISEYQGIYSAASSGILILRNPPVASRRYCESPGRPLELKDAQLIEGAAGHLIGVYRPAMECAMRIPSLQIQSQTLLPVHPVPFCPVCSRHIEQKLFGVRDPRAGRTPVYPDILGIGGKSELSKKFGAFVQDNALEAVPTSTLESVALQFVEFVREEFRNLPTEKSAGASWTHGPVSLPAVTGDSQHFLPIFLSGPIAEIELASRYAGLGPAGYLEYSGLGWIVNDSQRDTGRDDVPRKLAALTHEQRAALLPGTVLTIWPDSQTYETWVANVVDPQPNASPPKAGIFTHFGPENSLFVWDGMTEGTSYSSEFVVAGAWFDTYPYKWVEGPGERGNSFPDVLERLDVMWWVEKETDSFLDLPEEFFTDMVVKTYGGDLTAAKTEYDNDKDKFEKYFIAKVYDAVVDLSASMHGYIDSMEAYYLGEDRTALDDLARALNLLQPFYDPHGKMCKLVEHVHAWKPPITEAQPDRIATALTNDVLTPGLRPLAAYAHPEAVGSGAESSDSIDSRKRYVLRLLDIRINDGQEVTTDLQDCVRNGLAAAHPIILALTSEHITPNYSSIPDNADENAADPTWWWIRSALDCHHSDLSHRHETLGIVVSKTLAELRAGAIAYRNLVFPSSKEAFKNLDWTPFSFTVSQTIDALFGDAADDPNPRLEHLAQKIAADRTDDDLINWLNAAFWIITIAATVLTGVGFLIAGAAWVTRLVALGRVVVALEFAAGVSEAAVVALHNEDVDTDELNNRAAIVSPILQAAHPKDRQSLLLAVAMTGMSTLLAVRDIVKAAVKYKLDRIAVGINPDVPIPSRGIDPPNPITEADLPPRPIWEALNDPDLPAEVRGHYVENVFHREHSGSRFLPDLFEEGNIRLRGGESKIFDLLMCPGGELVSATHTLASSLRSREKALWKKFQDIFFDIDTKWTRDPAFPYQKALDDYQELELADNVQDAIKKARITMPSENAEVLKDLINKRIEKHGQNWDKVLKNRGQKCSYMVDWVKNQGETFEDQLQALFDKIIPLD